MDLVARTILLPGHSKKVIWGLFNVHEIAGEWFRKDTGTDEVGAWPVSDSWWLHVVLHCRSPSSHIRIPLLAGCSS